MDIWSPTVGDEFTLEIDELNIHDRYAVATKMDGHVVTWSLVLCGHSMGHYSGSTGLTLHKTLD